MDRVRVNGQVHPVPLGAGLVSAAFALLGIGVAVFGNGGLAVGLFVGGLFGALAVLFFTQCIPPWIELDDEGLRFREKFRVGRLLWGEIEALGTGMASGDISPGSLLVKLTPAACVARKVERPDALYHVSVSAVEALRQRELLAAARARWMNAGGSGNTFDLLGKFFEAGRQLRESAQMLQDIQRQQNPGAAAALDRMRALDKPGDDPTFCSIIHVRGDDGSLVLNIIAGGDDLDALTRTVASEAERLVREHRFNPEFGGELQVSLVPDLTPNTKALTARMDELVARTLEEFARSHLTAAGGRAIRMSWKHGH